MLPRGLSLPGRHLRCRRRICFRVSGFDLQFQSRRCWFGGLVSSCFGVLAVAVVVVLCFVGVELFGGVRQEDGQIWRVEGRWSLLADFMWYTNVWSRLLHLEGRGSRRYDEASRSGAVRRAAQAIGKEEQ